MFCNQCGAQIEEGKKFCPKCQKRNDLTISELILCLSITVYSGTYIYNHFLIIKKLINSNALPVHFIASDIAFIISIITGVLSIVLLFRWKKIWRRH
jgi:hypothetical protein